MDKEELEKLFAVVDPDLAEMIKADLQKKKPPFSAKYLKILGDETMWAMSCEMSFGHAIANAYINLIGNIDHDKLLQYRDLTRQAGKIGPTFGRLMAQYLVPVLKHGDSLILELFLAAVEIMREKGVYTLKGPLKSLAMLLITDDKPSTVQYLKLLSATYSNDMTYSQCQHFSYVLPKAVLSFSSSKRPWQIKQLTRLVHEDFRLVDPFLVGMEKGLYLLSKKALFNFVSFALEKVRLNMKLGIKILSLASKLGIDAYQSLQVTVPLSQVAHQISHYLRARTGVTIPIRPLSILPKASGTDDDNPPGTCCDGKFIYLPDEIGSYINQEENVKLYHCLSRFESAYFEFGTFNFDLEKAMENSPRFSSITQGKPSPDKISDLQRFFLLFSNQRLASDLFSIFEQGRIRILLARQYPGLIRKFLPMLKTEAMSICQEESVNPVYLLYLRIALGSFAEEKLNTAKEHINKIVSQFEKKILEDNTVEACAHLVIGVYPKMEAILNENTYIYQTAESYRPIQFPFGRQLRPDLYYLANSEIENVAQTVKTRIEAKGFKVYKAEIRKRLEANRGILTPEDVEDMIGTGNFQRVELQEIIGHSKPQTVDISFADEDTNHTFRYKEWDCNIEDYINEHVRVVEKLLPGYPNDYYHKILMQHQALVKKIKYAFELLKPEGVKMLRQWIEGDEFDYRALLDFVMDKRAGITPSDRLYIKRIKEQRDVAVLLLVDLSRSTANAIYGTNSTNVLEVEKEAIVLFCEALEVVGDAFAIAGFSGTGRLGVDYFQIKDFKEDMTASVKQRISAMAPQRSTRMGAAIRHGASKFDSIDSKVRLMIILSDGFPNDVDYKQDYAIKDTRRAISEVHSKNIYVHSITVNLARYSKLDDLYGDLNHNVISDIRELPDKLLRIYSRLTR
ncbi:MAG: VWA domain-containing protein [Deltaproteobacteria bacterium]|nr:VWA domain-containing protein [Deltaproteobacteria bacterium]